MISYRNNLVTRPDPAFPRGFTPFPESAQPRVTFDVLPKHKPRKRIDVIKAAVCVAFNTTAVILESGRRSVETARPRFAVALLARNNSKCTFPDIGRALGGRDHSTVIHAIKRAKALLIEDMDFADRYAEAEKIIKGSI